MVEDLASLSETAEEDRRLQVWISGELHGRYNARNPKYL